MIDNEILLSKNFDAIQIVEDAAENSQIIKKIINSKDAEDAFYTLDVGEVIERHRSMISKMPRVEPYYAIKCNPHPTVLKTMAALNTGFDCALKQEIELLMAIGVTGERIIFSHTAKLISHIRLAKTAEVEMMTVDGEPELHKIKNIYPEAKIIIRFRCDTDMSMISLGAKFGCDAETVAPKLVRLAKDLGLNIYGFNFNVGTQCSEPAVYGRGIKIAVGLIEYSKSLGFPDVKLINIGGGFPSEDCLPIDGFADTINEALKGLDPSIRVISEPGRNFVATAFTLISSVIGKKTLNEGHKIRYIYYVNDGIFGSFFDSGMNIHETLPITLNKSAGEEPHPTTILGPYLTARDCVVRDCLLPKLNIGDWLIWPYMGAYTRIRWRVSNRMHLPVVFPFIKRKVWEQNQFLNRDSGEQPNTYKVIS